MKASGMAMPHWTLRWLAVLLTLDGGLSAAPLGQRQAIGSFHVQIRYLPTW